MSPTLGLIGSGMIGAAVARLAVTADLDVILSNSRTPETLADLVAELGGRATAATPSEAAEADLVVVAIPLHAYDRLPVAALAGKTVLDTTNYYPERDWHMPELDSAELTSSALLQRRLAKSRVVKAFNTITPHQLSALARSADAPDRSALPIAGDDAQAKAAATQLLDLLGYDAVDTGTLADSWRIEPNTSAYIRPYLGDMPAMDVGEFLRWTRRIDGIPVPATQLRKLVDTATRLAAGEARLPSAENG
ncbi:NADPH-dependent F420 reductase [Nocardia arthritidis]|uniref:Oxidoreductase n=1 Tax=Nocardia arthritidis TaxID=228602 RepID=A0A6G9YH40_9NOCA|nr:NAD(P)-binding domain-containing protein [Nocardia arthritidis]QIS12559.1 oxidoreductase [Nocardia arthritidis]